MQMAEGDRNVHYVIGDIHNNNRKFDEMLKKIRFLQKDHLYLLGDLFDRNSWEPGRERLLQRWDMEN